MVVSLAFSQCKAVLVFQVLSKEVILNQGQFCSSKDMSGSIFGGSQKFVGGLRA